MFVWSLSGVILHLSVVILSFLWSFCVSVVVPNLYGLFESLSCLILSLSGCFESQ